MRPQQYIESSDYGSVKNDARGRISLTIPNGDTIPGNGGSRTWLAEMELGTRNASLRVQTLSSLRPTEWLPGQIRFIDMTVSGSFGAQTETGAVSVVRVSATRIRIYCTHFNFDNVTQTVVGGQTITADVVTFLSPFN